MPEQAKQRGVVLGHHGVRNDHMRNHFAQLIDRCLAVFINVDDDVRRLQRQQFADIYILGAAHFRHLAHLGFGMNAEARPSNHLRT